ncbi:MAG: AAA family ATPase [Marinisporobacter sp.]|jgi:AAA15 family ATPase/GTPase|nr:AAA family ATPase [Marinisporobacter sp.]
MLINAVISNFMSIGENRKLSMVSGKARSKREHLLKDKKFNLLRLSTVYGANASGKSNLISSFEFAQKSIIKEIPKGYTNEYNRTYVDNINKPSHFEFEIKVDNSYYSYGFEIILNKGSIVSEWLYECFPNDIKNKKIFERDLINKEFSIGSFKNSSTINRIAIYFDDVKNLDTVLFLSEMNRNKSDLYKEKNELTVFNDVYKWFKYSLDINYPNRLFSNYSYFLKTAKTEEICEMIKKFDTGITSFEIIDAKQDELNNKVPKDILKKITEELEEDISVSKKEGKDISSIGAILRGDKDFYILEVNEEYDIEIKTVEFRHGDCGTFRLYEESDGTRRILELIEILFSENDDKVYIIDEIDRSLHPLLTQQFIKAYIDSLEDRKIQLIVTTHESRLLDLDLLRRDEIWFMNKNSRGDSELYSLEQYNERFDKKIDKAYLAGRYGAIPSFREE